MKTKSLVLIGILIIAFAAIVIPVMAADTTTITGNPDSVISISVTGGTVDLSSGLSPQLPPAEDSTQTLTVSANGIGWTVAVSDALDNSKPAGSKGFMVEALSSAGAYVTPSPKNLTAVMNVTGGSMTGATGATVKLDGGGVIETGTAAVDGTTGSITFQQIANYVDQVLTGTETYRTVVTFTATAP
jgi:hypothetical protein